MVVNEKLSTNDQMTSKLTDKGHRKAINNERNQCRIANLKRPQNIKC